MKHNGSTTRAAFRLGRWGIFGQLLLLGNLLFAASPGLTLQVSSETAPAGGFAQIKISAPAPVLISSGGISISLDPAIFGNISSVAVFSASGDQIGYTRVSGTQAIAYFYSPTAGVGQLPGIPIMVVNVPVLAGAITGAAAAITVNSSPQLAPPWQDPQGDTYMVTVNPGTFTVGGGLSVGSVTPGGGLLPAGAVVALTGTGFDPGTAIAVDGLSIASKQFVSAEEIDVTFGGATELSGKHLRVTNSAGASADYFTSLTASGLILPLLPSPQDSVTRWAIPFDPGFQQVFSCLQNPTASPVTATYYVAGTNGVTPLTQSFVIPPYGLLINPTFVLAGKLAPLAAIYLTVSAPVRMAQFTLVTFNLNGPQSAGLIPAQPITGSQNVLGNLGIRASPTAGTFTWQAGTPAPQPLTVTVTSGFPFSISLSSGASAWLSVTATSGGPGITRLTFTPVVSTLGVGTYTATVTFTELLPPELAQFGPATASYTATLQASSQPTIIGPASQGFSMTLGDPAPAPITIQIASNGTPAAFTAAVTPISGGNWLSAGPASGTTPASLTLTVNPAGLGVGTYQSSLQVQGPINSLNGTVQLVITPPALSVFPKSITFSLLQGVVGFQVVDSAPPATSISVSTSTQSGANWLSATVNSLSALVSVDTTGLNPGSYTGTVTITSNSGSVALVPVFLTVRAGTPPPPPPAQMTVTPMSFTLTAPAGATATANVTVTNVSGPPTFSVLTNSDYQVAPPYANMLDTAPATVPVIGGHALPGTYHDSFTVSWNGGSAVIPVTFYATAAPATPPTIATVAASGSMIAGAIAPGELITILGSGLGGAPELLQLDAGGKVETSLSGTQLMINGTAAPLIYAATGQLNAIVPYEVGNTGVANLEVISNGVPGGAWGVPLAASAPAIFTLPESGVGPGAIVNPDGTVNGPANPAPRGGIVEIYASGGGQTTPLSTTGSLAPSAANLELMTMVRIGGVDAHVTYAGSATGEVEGVVQINAVISTDIAPGTALPVITVIGGVASQAGVTIAVK
jgi:uncharacterized protein (TIGR03437 family)